MDFAREHFSTQQDLIEGTVSARALEVLEVGLIIDVVLLLGIRDREDRLA